jgi:hypothetical protein
MESSPIAQRNLPSENRAEVTRDDGLGMLAHKGLQCFASHAELVVYKLSCL